MSEHNTYWISVQQFPQYFYFPYNFNHQNYDLSLSSSNNVIHSSQKIIIQRDELQIGKKKEKQELNSIILPILKQKSEKKIKNHRKKNKDQDYKTKAQKKDRNLNSIIIKNFASYFHKNPLKEVIFNKITQKYNLSIKFFEFYKQFTQKMPLRKSYIGINQFFSLILTNKDSEISLISRIIFSKFIGLDIYPTILRSNKIKQLDKSREVRHKSKLIQQINKKVLQIQKQDQKQKSREEIQQVMKQEVNGQIQILLGE